MIVLKYNRDLYVSALHVFQMMKEATEEQRQEWEMPRERTFAWLPNAEQTLEGSHSLYLFCYLF